VIIGTTKANICHALIFVLLIGVILSSGYESEGLRAFFASSYGVGLAIVGGLYGAYSERERQDSERKAAS